MFRKIIFACTLLLCAFTGFAQQLDYSFVVVGCNRVDAADTTGDPSTANLYQLRRLFTEVSQMSPLPRYLFMAGDVVLGYAPDTVLLAKQLRAWKQEYYNSPLASTSVRLVVIPGNHETQNKSAGKTTFPAAERTFLREMDPFIIGSNGPKATGLVPGTDSLITDQSRLTYSFDYHGDHFVMVDTDPMGRDSRVPFHWIGDDLAMARSAGARHIFTIGHKPAYPSPIVPTDGLVQYPSERNMYWSALEKNRCEAMFSAHNHLWDKVHPHEGKTWQIIAGNGGSNIEAGWATANPHPYFGYTQVNIYTNGTVAVKSMGRNIGTYYTDATPANPTTLRDSVDITWTACDAVTVTSQPVTPAPVCAGGGQATFSVSVAGPGPYTYQWMENSVPLTEGGVYSGTNTAVLTITNPGNDMNGKSYSCYVTGCIGQVNTTSQSAVLTVYPVTSVISSTTTAYACNGNAGTLSVQAAGSNLSYQWQQQIVAGGAFTDMSDNADFSGTHSASLTWNNLPYSRISGYLYRCHVSGSCGDLYSSSASFVKAKSASIVANPENRTTCVGSSATFKVTSLGTNLKYRWQRSVKDGPFYNMLSDSANHGVFSSELTVYGLKAYMSGNRYRCVVTGVCAPAVTSADALLTVIPCTERDAAEEATDAGAEVLVLKVVPNPVSSEATVYLPTSALESQWQISDLNGRIVGSGRISGNVKSFSINTSTYAQGIYTVTVRREGGETIYTRLVVVR